MAEENNVRYVEILFEFTFSYFYGFSTVVAIKLCFSTFPKKFTVDLMDLIISKKTVYGREKSLENSKANYTYTQKILQTSILVCILLYLIS